MGAKRHRRRQSLHRACPGLHHPRTLHPPRLRAAQAIFVEIFSQWRVFRGFRKGRKVGISVSAAQANAALKRLPHALSSAMQEEVHQRGNHQQCQQEAKDSPAAAGLRSDWGAVVGGHKASAVRVLGLTRAAWLEVLRVTERVLVGACLGGEAYYSVHENLYVSGTALIGERLR